MISLACVKNFRSSLAWLILNCLYVIFLAIGEVRKPSGSLRRSKEKSTAILKYNSDVLSTICGNCTFI